MPLIIGRKKRDQAGLSAVQSGKQRSYVTVSRKTVHPQTGQKIARGSEVSMKPKQSVIGTVNRTVPTGLSIGPSQARYTSSFKPADMTEGTVKVRSTTPDFAGKYNENPNKVAIRMKAQANGQTTYPHPKTGKPELSGVTEVSKKVTPGAVNVSSRQVVTPVYGQTAGLNVSSPKGTGQSSGRLRARAITMGGSDRSGRPATKHGVGFKNRAVILKKKSY